MPFVLLRRDFVNARMVTKPTCVSRSEFAGSFFDRDEPEHPVGQVVTAIHADDQISAPGLVGSDSATVKPNLTLTTGRLRRLCISLLLLRNRRESSPSDRELRTQLPST